MARLSITSAFVALAFALGARAAIGPVTDLHISDVNINPDGLARDAVLAEGVFPGPLIQGNKVRMTQVFIDNDAILTNHTGRQLSNQCDQRAL